MTVHTLTLLEPFSSCGFWEEVLQGSGEPLFLSRVNHGPCCCRWAPGHHFPHSLLPLFHCILPASPLSLSTSAPLVGLPGGETQTLIPEGCKLLFAFASQASVSLVHLLSSLPDWATGDTQVVHLDANLSSIDNSKFDPT